MVVVFRKSLVVFIVILMVFSLGKNCFASADNQEGLYYVAVGATALANFCERDSGFTSYKISVGGEEMTVGTTYVVLHKIKLGDSFIKFGGEWFFTNGNPGSEINISGSWFQDELLSFSPYLEFSTNYSITDKFLLVISDGLTSFNTNVAGKDYSCLALSVGIGVDMLLDERMIDSKKIGIRFQANVLDSENKIFDDPVVTSLSLNFSY